MSPYVLEEWADLRTLNTFGVAARCRWLATLHSAGAVGELLARAEFRGLPVMALGEGSNLLLAADDGEISARDAVAGCALFGIRENSVRVDAVPCGCTHTL